MGVVYKLALIKTIKLYNQSKEINSSETNINNLQSTLHLLDLKKKANDSIINKYNINNRNIQNILLNFIDQFTYNDRILLVDFQEPISYSENNTQYLNYQLTFEGDFESILMLIHKIENEKKFGKIISLKFQKNFDLKTGKTFLTSYILLQKID